MEIKDIFKLIDAGFTKDEILKLTAIDTGEKAEEVKTEEVAPVEEEKTVEETKPAPTDDSRLDDVIKGLQKVTETMQKTALQNSRQPEPESLDDILAHIINPTYKNE